MHTKTTHLIATALIALLASSACASGPSGPDDDLTDKSPEQRLYEARVVLAELQSSPDSGLVARELDRAGVWIGRAESIFSQPERDPDRVELLLEVIEGQLVQVRALYSAKDASDSLELTRRRYERRMGAIDDARRANDEKLNTPSTQEVP